MDNTYLFFGILVAFGATFLTRVIPFVWFSKRKPSPILGYIEISMPVMIMIILVFYAIRDLEFQLYPYGIPELIGIALAAIIHLVFKQALLSIVIATISYMVIVQFVI